MSEKSLTLFSRSGLANRLRVLVSGLAVAETAGRAFTMYWPRTPPCSAVFGELFSNKWPVIDVDVLDPSIASMHVDAWYEPSGRQLLTDTRERIVLGLNTWVIKPGDRSTPEVGRRCNDHIRALQPIPELSERIAGFKARHFRPTMIGVHLRRGDFLRHRPDVAGNTKPAMDAVDKMLATAPDAGILLCTDDGALDPYRRETEREGVREAFEARYGDRVVSPVPRSLDRRKMEAVQDALVELWLLRETAMIVGTTGSSFSGFTIAGRRVPYVFLGGGLARYRHIEWLVRASGAHWLVRRVFRAVYGFDQPFPKAWNIMRSDLRRKVRVRTSGSKPA